MIGDNDLGHRTLVNLCWKNSGCYVLPYGAHSSQYFASSIGRKSNVFL